MTIVGVALKLVFGVNLEGSVAFVVSAKVVVAAKVVLEATIEG